MGCSEGCDEFNSGVQGIQECCRRDKGINRFNKESDFEFLTWVVFSFQTTEICSEERDCATVFSRKLPVGFQDKIIDTLDTETMIFSELVDFFEQREEQPKYRGLAGWRSGRYKAYYNGTIISSGRGRVVQYDVKRASTYCTSCEKKKSLHLSSHKRNMHHLQSLPFLICMKWILRMSLLNL